MVTLGVDSPLEFYTTIIGWRLYNDMWLIITNTGLAYIPFFAILITNFSQFARSQTKVNVTEGFLRVLEVKFLMAMIVILVAGYPSVPLHTDQLRFQKICHTEKEEYKNKNYTFSTDPSLYKHASFVSPKEQINVPVWWYAVMAFSSGFTYSAKQGLPCEDDLVSQRYTDMSADLSSELLREIVDFTRQCYLPTHSFARFGSKRIQPDKWHKDSYDLNLKRYGKDELNWFGSLIFADTLGPYFYKGRLSHQERQPWNKVVSCRMWLLGGEGYKGIFHRIFDEKSRCVTRLTHTLERSKRLFESEKKRLKNFNYQSPIKIAEHNCVRNIFINNPTSESNKLYYSLNDVAIHREQSTWDTVKSYFNTLTSDVGVLLYKLTNLPVSQSLQEAMPAGVTLIIMALYVIIPFGLVFSSYSIQFIVVCSVGLFAMKFTHYLFYLAKWITVNLFSIMGLAYSNNNSYAADIYMFVANSLFIVFPLVFIAIMAWAGIQVGFGLQTTYSQLAGDESSVAKAAATGADIIQQLAVRLVSGQLGQILKAKLASTKLGKSLRSKLNIRSASKPSKHKRGSQKKSNTTKENKK